jgi:hypothetical protein
MTPLSSAVLSTVKLESVSAACTAPRQIGNAAGVAAIGAVSLQSKPQLWRGLALHAACALFGLWIIICAAFLTWMRRAT